MADAREEAARAALLAVVADLEGTGRRLEAIHDGLPITREEKSRHDLDHDPAPATEMRAVIRNVLADSLAPAIQDLRVAAEYRPENPVAGPAWDLTVYSEEVRHRLYDLVVQQDFSPKPLADPGDTWIPPYAPQQAGLRVFFEHGRWFAAWQKLEVPESSPEMERWELLRLEERRDKPGVLFTYEV